ncbi:hypothetical protein [Halomonas sp. S2151]|uniref:hypothetical protein n=1 Tax=Halomonas sp. S2151 TaxID=579478 RepID=UPI0012EE0E26|nr:hypothetical protein [Halomonas sp. S2151]
MKAPIFAVIFATALTGCQIPATIPVERTVAYPANEYSQLETTGTSSINGQLFLRTRGGDVKYGAGSEITITPVTSYSQEEVMIIERGRIPAPADPRAEKYTRKVIADGSGRFKVENLPSGEYYVAGDVFWAISGQPLYMPRQGTTVVKKTVINPGETINLMLTE